MLAGNIGKYVTKLSGRSCIVLSKFRTTNNRFPIEKGRWENIERNQRFCHLCNKNLIGNEYQYSFACKSFKHYNKIIDKQKCENIKEA